MTVRWGMDAMGGRRVVDLSKFHYEQPDHYTVRDCFIDYTHHRLIKRGKDPLRAWSGFMLFMDIVPPKQDVTKITEGQVEDYVDLRMTTCGSLLTPKRELTFVKAAILNAHRRNHIQVVPYFEIPSAEPKYRRPLTEPEFRLVMSKPMSERLRRFYWLAYYVGHRSQAMEQFQWPGVNFETGLMNFNVPGRLVTNKKRCSAFPIPDEFLPRLLSWKERAKNNYVIGLGPKGVCSSTYSEAAYVVRELAGLTDPTLVPRHCMRKMFATELADRMIAATGQADMHTIGFLIADEEKTVRDHYFECKKERIADAANLRTRALVVA